MRNNSSAAGTARQATAVCRAVSFLQCWRSNRTIVGLRSAHEQVIGAHS
jgi:hypothetical protein